MSLDWRIIFNSGQADEFTLSKGSNVANIQITNSDQSYYQNANLTLFGLSDTQEDSLRINSKVHIKINEQTEFDGYVSRIQKSIAGKRVFDLQCVGRTYDLWRFKTSSDTAYSNKYTGYIVSSLVATYCSGDGLYIQPPDVSPDTGVAIKYVEFSDMKVGDCIARMAQMDGYAFYVDSDGQLQYYEPTEESQFTVGESDIIDMTPIDESDDSLKNDILILGSTEYEVSSAKTGLTGYIPISTSTKYVAQRVYMPDYLHKDILSSIKVYTNRTTGEDSPMYLQGDIRKDNSGVPSSTAIPSSTSISWSSTDVATPPDWTPYYTFMNPEDLNLSKGNYYWITFKYDGATPSSNWSIGYGTYGSIIDDLSSDPNLSGNFDYNSIDFGDVTYDSANDEIDFYAKCRGYAASGCFDNNGSRRFREFSLSGGGINSDQIVFRISANILDWNGGSYAGYPKNEDDKYKPKLMIGVLDSSSPNGFDYNPMVGVEFNLYRDELLLYEYATGSASATQSNSIESSLWYAQTFTVGTTGPNRNFKIKKVGVELKKDGTGSTNQVKLSIRETDEDGKPKSTYLCEVTKDASTLPTSYDWVWFDLSSCDVTLNSSTTYAIVIGATSDSSPYVYWRVFGPTSIYAGGGCSVSFDAGNTWSSVDPSDYRFKIYGVRSDTNIEKVVRAFIAKDITKSSPSNPEYIHGDWVASGANSYECKISGSNLVFSVDNTVEDVLDLSNVTLEGNYKFGTGYSYNWDKLRVQLIDVGSPNSQSTDTYCFNSYDSYELWYYPSYVFDCDADTYGWSPFCLGLFDNYVQGIGTNYTTGHSSNEIIDKVEVRFRYRIFGDDASSYYPWSYIEFKIRYSDGSYSGKHSYSLLFYSSNPLWTDWIDVTNYENSPTPWTWSEISNLGIKLGHFNAWCYLGCDVSLAIYKVELRVTYHTVSDTLPNISGNIGYYKLEGIGNEYLAVSTDSGQNWTKNTNQYLLTNVGWNYDTVRGSARSDNSIATYGRHFYKVTEPLLTTYVDCENYANRLLEKYASSNKKGEVTIHGRTGIDINSKFTLSSSRLGVNELFEIAQYTQIIDNDGFKTKIAYGEAPYDIARKVAQLESEVYG